MHRFIFILFYPLYIIYLLFTSVRNFLYNKNILLISKLPCKIISVGNISMGGTGKTPTVISLTQQLQKKYKVAILSRGYGRHSKGTQLVTDGKSKQVDWKLVGDEPSLMANKLNKIPIVVDENRIRGGKYLADKFNPDIILLDDAFQHRKIHRDVDVVLVDASKKPKLKLSREPWSSLKRADLIILTKVTNDSNIPYWKNKLSKYDVPNFESETLLTDSLIGLDGKTVSTDTFKKKPALIFSGIGNPQFFNYSVSQLGFDILDTIIYKDHHKYTDSDSSFIRSKFHKTKAKIILTTEKDIIKLPQSELPIYAVPITMNIAPAVINEINESLD